MEDMTQTGLKVHVWAHLKGRNKKMPDGSTYPTV